MSNKSFMGKGSIYLEEIGGTAGLLPIGNCSSLSLTFNEDKKEQKDYEEAGGAVIDTVSRISSVTGAIVALNFDAANMALAVRGLTTSVTAAAVTLEPHVAKIGGFIKFVSLPNMAIAPVITNVGATVTYTVDVDYEVKNGGIKILAGGVITADLAIECNYTKIASKTIEGLTSSSKQYRLYFDGLNEADSGKPATVLLHRTNFNPVQALSLIGDEFAELAMNFDILKDTSIVGASISKFVKMDIAD
jgi:hypothetical protein